MTAASSLFEAALAHAQKGQFAPALNAVDQALAIAPDDAAALALKAALLSETGDPAAALPLFERAVAVDPINPAVHSNHGAALARTGALTAAVESFDRALALAPRHAGALCNRAGVLIDLNRPTEALADARRALTITPGHPAARLHEAQALLALGRNDEAAARFDVLTRERPDHFAALTGLGAARHNQMRFSEAIAAFDRALTLRPTDAEALRQRGMALLNLGRREEALAAMDAAVVLKPTLATLHIDRGVILTALGRYEEGIRAFDQAADLATDQALPIFRRAQARLRLGDFAGGWRDHERRWDDPAFVRASAGFATGDLRARFDPLLDLGRLAGSRVLAVGEQGIGDQIMFASMAHDLAQTASEVVCICDPRLVALGNASMNGVVRFTGPSEAPGADAFDVVVPLGSLGRLFRNSTSDFPGAPYLRPRSSVIEAWRERLGSGGGRRRIGLSWRGGLPATNGPWRSLDPAALAPLLARDDCEFISLQYGDMRADLEVLNNLAAHPVRAFAAADIDDFEQLAALVLNLDGVVSVQTALIHLCGAIGAPVRVMVPFAPEWRYGHQGSSMPWYGSVRLFRQPAPGGWESVLAQVAASLDEIR